MPASTLTQSRKLVSFALTFFVVFLLGFLFSQNAPFFPAEGERKQLSKTQIGFVFGVMDISAGITCLFITDSIKSQWMKTLFLFGFFGHGFFGSLFGVMDFVANSWVFFIGCCITQILTGISAAVTFVAAFALANSWYPNRTSRVTGYLQSSMALGLMAGPGIGGLLYQWGGYVLPFVVPGAIKVILSFLAYFIVLGFQEPEYILAPSSNTQEATMQVFLCLLTFSRL